MGNHTSEFSYCFASLFVTIWAFTPFFVRMEFFATITVTPYSRLMFLQGLSITVTTTSSAADAKHHQRRTPEKEERQNGSNRFGIVKNCVTSCPKRRLEYVMAFHRPRSLRNKVWMCKSLRMINAVGRRTQCSFEFCWEWSSLVRIILTRTYPTSFWCLVSTNLSLHRASKKGSLLSKIDPREDGILKGGGMQCSDAMQWCNTMQYNNQPNSRIRYDSRA